MGSRPGIFVQQHFNFGPLGPRDWSLDEMRRLFSWLKDLGYDTLAFPLLTVIREPSGEFNVYEQASLYHSVLGAPGSFAAGSAYGPSDRYLGTPKGLARAELLRDQMRLARQMGFSTSLVLWANIAAPQFAEEHPELAAVASSDIYLEGTALCPSREESLEHLLAFYTEQVRYFDAADGYVLHLRDPGGCTCERCTPQGRMFEKLIGAYHAMIRSQRPDSDIALYAWHMNLPEVAHLAANLPEDITIFETRRIHAMDVSFDDFGQRVNEWKKHGRRLAAWFQIQENPTALFPSVYPRRIQESVKVARELGFDGFWGGATQTPYLFPLHFWLLPQLLESGDDLETLLRRFLAESFGQESVEAGLRYLDLTERTWDKAQAESQWRAGLIQLTVNAFAFRLLPEESIVNGVPEETRRDLQAAADLALEAWQAAEAFASSMRRFHAQDANIIVNSAQVLYHRIRMRCNKLPVLDALHAGDGDEAVRRWRDVQEECDRMIAAARNAPNTDILLKHWRRFDLLPKRLETVAQHLPELAERKRYRPIRQPVSYKEHYDLTDPEQ